MQDLINKHLANGFSGFKGIRIEETLPVTEGTINELIMEMQTNMVKSSSNATTAVSSSNLDLDIGTFLRLVKKAEIRAEHGRLTLEIRYLSLSFKGAFR